MKGYTINEWQQMADQQLSLIERAVTYLTPFASLTANALGHLRADWIEWRDEYVRITVPPQAPCNSFKSAGPSSGHLPPLTSREQPCNCCRNTGTTDQFEHLWPGGRTDQHYTTPLHRELAAPAVDILTEVFDTHKRPEFPAEPTTIRNAAQTVGSKKTRDKERTYPKLLRTGPVLYAEYGLSKRDIAEITRYSEATVEDIIGLTPGVNFEKISTLSFLRTLKEMEPATVAELADELDLVPQTIKDRLAPLRDTGKVAVENNHRGAPAATWQTADNWEAPFTCQHCEFGTRSLQGIRLHQSKMH